MDALIVNGTLADCNGERCGDLQIRDGIIFPSIGGAGRSAQSAELLAHAAWVARSAGVVLDAANLFILPAFIDMHVHLREPGFTQKEDIESGARAALRGGFTTVNAMANTNPVCSSLQIAREVALKAKELGFCDVYQTLSATKNFDGETINHLDELKNDPERNIVKFVSEDGRGIADSKVFYDVLVKCKELGRTLLIHAEDAAFSAADMYAAEDLETLRDLYLIEKAGARAHFCHVSTEFSARAIIAAKKRGVSVSFEVTPHHLALNDATDFRVNPPLRKESDRRFLIDAIKRGEVDMIATDHAPHTAEDKLNGSPGLVGLETAFSVCYSVLCKDEGLSLPELSRLMSKNPAVLMNVNKGELSEGFIGDAVVVDLSEKVKIDAAEFASKGRNTPFDGREFFGKIKYVVKEGKVYDYRQAV